MESLNWDVAIEANARREDHKKAADKIIGVFRDMNFTYADAQMTLCTVKERISQTAQRARI